MSALPVVIREEYLSLMNGDHCAAAILNAFEMWSRNKADYIYKSVIEMQADLMGLFGRNRVGDAFKELCRRGFLLKRKNPTLPTDQTLQYLFQPLIVYWAVFNRMLTTLKPQALSVMLQTLILKSQALSLKHESESISEIKSEIKSEMDSKIISERERFLSEGVDQAKFIQDDPNPDPEHVPPYLHQVMPSAAVRQQLTVYSAKLGAERYAEVIARCANARSWEYVLKALANEPIPSPRSAPPPSKSAPEMPELTPAEVRAERVAFLVHMKSLFADMPGSFERFCKTNGYSEADLNPTTPDDDPQATPETDPVEIEAAK